MFEKLYLNTNDPGAVALVHQHGLGLEVDSYLWPLSDDELPQVHKSVRAMLDGVSRLVMHGPVISSDLDVLAALDPQEVRRTYEQAFASARLHQINRIVFHPGFVPGRHEDASWLESAVSFWRRFLTDKGGELAVYIENMVDDDPSMAVMQRYVGHGRGFAAAAVGGAGRNIHFGMRLCAVAGVVAEPTGVGVVTDGVGVE